MSLEDISSVSLGDLDVHKLCFYDCEWQSLRVSLLGSWATLDGVKSNLQRLTSYLKTSPPTTTRLWRVLNLLNAVIMGYNGQQRGDSSVAKVVIEYRDKISLSFKASKLKNGDKIDVDPPDKIRREWNALPTDVQVKIVKDLTKRLDAHKGSAHREELRYFLLLVK